MWILYDLFFLLFSVIYLPYMLVKRKCHRGFAQRFGFLPDSVKGPDRPIWIHAVSVGEAGVAVKLASGIKGAFPGSRVIVSTTTRTGNDIVRPHVGRSIDGVFYFPLDLSFVVSKVIRTLRPSLFIMVETELWPNLLLAMRKTKVPVVLANGRISNRSFANYSFLSFLLKDVFGAMTLCCMQHEKDAERIRKMGVPAERVFVTGNIKFDDALGAAERPFTPEELGFPAGSPVLVAGSTHCPEERMLVDCFARLAAAYPSLKLVLVPRHVERADAVDLYVRKRGLRSRRFTEILLGKKRERPADVLLVDTIGHLKRIYGAASVIFIGGSLVKKGGQNPIEGARFAKPVVFGPHMFNFREIADAFLAGMAAVCVRNEGELFSGLDILLEDGKAREAMGKAAERIVRENSGALGRTVEQIEKLY